MLKSCRVLLVGSEPRLATIVGRKKEGEGGGRGGYIIIRWSEGGIYNNTVG